MKRAVFGAIPLVGALGLHLAFSLKILPSFAKLFVDFGGELPWLTRMALSPAWAVGWGLWLVVGGGFGLSRLALGRRPKLLAAVLGVMSIAWVVAMFAMYLPIFTIAGTIKE